MDNHGSGFRARLARFAAPACAVFVAAFAFFHASRGVVWSRSFHPDEQQIARWMAQSSELGYVADRVYPGGWFVLMDLAAGAERRWTDLWRRLDARRAQDGRVVATDAASFGRIPRREPCRKPGVQDGRDFNVLLFALAALFLFLTARETGAGPVPAAFAALLFAVQPFPLEHAHYCETDMALAASFSLAGWWAARAVRTGSARWACAACAAAGFAIACKFTVAPVLVWIPALAFAVPGRAGGTKRTCLFALAAAAGFLAGTPALWKAPDFFFSDLFRAGDATYAESCRALGAGHSYPAACLWRAGRLAAELGRLGPAPLLFFAVSLPCWFAPRFRRWLPVFPLFLAAFVLHAVFLMPWIRNQETLPLLPVLCLGAAPAAALAAGSFGRSAPARRKAAAAAALALAAAALCSSARSGERILSCFQRRDTRAECQNWFAAAARPGVGVATEQYVGQALRGTDCTAVPFPNAAETWPAAVASRELAEGGVRYVLRNAAFSGRAERGRKALARESRFRRDCIPLAGWTIAPGIRTTTFAQPDVELWALPAPEDGPAPADVPICLDRPVFFAPGLRPLYAPDEPSPGVGPVRAVAAVGMRHAVHPAAHGPCWAVSRVFDGPKAGAIVWDGLFKPARTAISPAGVAVSRLDERALRRAAACDVRPMARVRLRGADDQATVCATQTSSDPAEIARILRRAGDPAAALAFLRERDAPDAAARVEAFLAARDARVAPEPEWTAAARDALAAFDAACATGALPPGTRVRGVPLRVLRDFATVRLGDWDSLTVPGDLPVFLPAGRYRVSAVPRTAEPAPDGPVPSFEGQEGPPAVRVDGNGTVSFESAVRKTGDGPLRTAPGGGTGPDGAPDFRSLSIEWDPAEQLARAVGELRAALAAESP